MSLTSKDQKVLIFIREYIRSQGKAPTLAEIRDGLGYRWLNSIQRSVSSLEKEGYLGREENRSRGIRLENSEPSNEVADIPLVGSVPCGTPLLAMENIEGYIPTDKSLLKYNAEEYFYLKAQGNSMDLAGIDDGNLLLIHSQSFANNGERVVALIGDEATVKVLKRATDYAILQPMSSNPNHRPIVLRDSLVIQGVVTKVLSL